MATWARIIRAPGTSPMVRALLTNASLLELSDTRAVIACPARYAPGARQRLAEIASVFTRELGRPIEVVIEEQSSPGGGGPEAAASAEATPSPTAPAAGLAAPTANPLDDPLVKTAVELFSARVVSVQPRRPQ